MTTRLRAVLTVTIDAEGDYYVDHADLIAHVVPWIDGTLEDRDDIRNVTITEQAPPADRAAAGLTTTERDVLRFALDLAQDQIHSRGNEFDEDDQTAVDTLRRMADEVTG